MYNKVDRLDQAPHLERDADGKVVAVWLSALRGDGMELLRQALIERAPLPIRHGWIRLEPTQGRLRARLYNINAVLSESIGNHGESYLEVRTTERNLAELSHREGFDLHSLSVTRLPFDAKSDGSNSSSHLTTCE